MFEVGDKIICIDISSYNGEFKWLKLYEIYTVKKILSIKNDKITHKSVVLEGTVRLGFDMKRFVSLSEYRRLKIKKICSKLEI